MVPAQKAAQLHEVKNQASRTEKNSIQLKNQPNWRILHVDLISAKIFWSSDMNEWQHHLPLNSLDVLTNQLSMADEMNFWLPKNIKLATRKQNLHPRDGTDKCITCDCQTIMGSVCPIRLCLFKKSEAGRRRRPSFFSIVAVTRT